MSENVGLHVEKLLVNNKLLHLHFYMIFYKNSMVALVESAIYVLLKHFNISGSTCFGYALFLLIHSFIMSCVLLYAPRVIFLCSIKNLLYRIHCVPNV